MNFEFTEEQRQVKELARRFAQGCIEPFVANNRDLEWEGTPDELFPQKVLEEAEDVGLRYLFVPEKYGGSNDRPNVLTQTLILEELSTADQGIATMLHQNWKGCKLLRAYPENVQERWFPQIVNNSSFTIAHMHTEPQGASDRLLPFNDPEANMNTTATQDDDGWVINGTKVFAANAYHADLFAITANTNSEVGVMDGTSLMIVPRDTTGLEVGRIHQSLGHRFMDQAEVYFDDVKIPDEYLLIKDTAMRDMGTIFPSGRVTVAAPMIGPGKAAYEATLEFVQEREQGGKYIAHHQMIKNRVATMSMVLELARTSLWRAAVAVDEGNPDADRLALIARIFTAEAAFNISRSAMEIHGGYGVMRDGGVERFIRDASTSLHGHGTQDIHKLKLANIEMKLDTLESHE